jgi:hypothetical protein
MFSSGAAAYSSHVTPSMRGAACGLSCRKTQASRAGVTWCIGDVNLSRLFRFAASRTQAGACDTVSRLCVRPVLCCPAVPLAPPLHSAASAPVVRVCSVALSVSGRRRRPLKGSPPSAAQTGRAVFPHPAFMNGFSRSEERGSVKQGLPARTPPEAVWLDASSSPRSATALHGATRGIVNLTLATRLGSNILSSRQ